MKHWRAYGGVCLCFCVLLLVSSCAWFSMLKSRDVDCQIDFVRSAGKDFLTCMEKFGGRCDYNDKEVVETLSLDKGGVETLSLLQPVSNFRSLFGMDNGKPVIIVPESPSVLAAKKVLGSKTLEKFIDVFKYVAGVDIKYLSKNVKVDKKQVPTFEFDRRKLQDFVEDVQNAIRFNGFWAINDTLIKQQDTLIKHAKLKAAELKAEAEAKLKAEGTSLPDFEKIELEKIKLINRIAAYIVAYTEAYFRDGKFYAVTLDEPALKELIKNKLKASFPELSEDQQTSTKNQLDKFIEDLIESVPSEGGKYRLVGKISETSFKTRGGVDYKFPAITATLKPGTKEFVTISKVDFVGVGADLIRVILEAIGDALAGVPGVTEATGCKKDPDHPDVALPVFEPENKQTFLTTDDFAKVNDYSNRVEGITSTVMGRVIRGVSWFSLNNESLAVLIETAVGVIAKKASEKVLWCGLCVYRKNKDDRKEGEDSYPRGYGLRKGEKLVRARFVISGAGK